MAGGLIGTAQFPPAKPGGPPRPLHRLRRHPSPPHRDRPAGLGFQPCRQVALTDHDTVAGVPEALEAGKRLGVEVLPGIEISADYEDTGAHFWATWWTGLPLLQEVIDWFVAGRETRESGHCG